MRIHTDARPTFRESNKVKSCKSIKVFYLLSCPLDKSLKDKGNLMSGPVYIKYVHNLSFMVFAV